MGKKRVNLPLYEYHAVSAPNAIKLYKISVYFRKWGSCCLHSIRQQFSLWLPDSTSPLSPHSPAWTFHFYSKRDWLSCQLPYCFQHCFVCIASESKHQRKESEEHKLLKLCLPLPNFLRCKLFHQMVILLQTSVSVVFWNVFKFL